MVVVVLLATLCLGFFVPIYVDEIASKLMRGMLFSDAGKYSTQFPQCNSEYLLSIPWSLYPGALVFAALYSVSSPLLLRLSGMMTVFALVAMVTFTIRAAIVSGRGRWLALAFVASSVGLGVVSLTFVMVRAEQAQALLITLFIYFPYFVRRYGGRSDAKFMAASVFAFCLAASAFLYVHPKSMFFSPVLIASAYATFRAKNWWVWLGVTAWVLLCTLQMLQFSVNILRCPSAPVFAAMLASVTVPIGSLLSSPIGFIKALLVNVVAVPGGIAQHAMFADRYQSDWIAPSKGILAVPVIVWINLAICRCITAIFSLAVVLPGVLFFWRCILRRVDTGTFCLLALWIGFIGHLALYRQWNFYSGGLILYLSALLIVLSVVHFQVKTIWASLLAVPVASVATVFVASAMIVFLYIAPRIVPTAFSAANGIPGQNFSVPVFGFSTQKEHIRSFAAECGIKDGMRRLVIDNLTFFAFSDLSEPLNSNYLDPHGFGIDLAEGDKLPKLLQSLGATHLIAQCTRLSPALQPWIVRQGDLCCLDLSRRP